MRPTCPGPWTWDDSSTWCSPEVAERAGRRRCAAVRGEPCQAQPRCGAVFRGAAGQGGEFHVRTAALRLLASDVRPSWLCRPRLRASAHRRGHQPVVLVSIQLLCRMCVTTWSCLRPVRSTRIADTVPIAGAVRLHVVPRTTSPTAAGPGALPRPASCVPDASGPFTGGWPAGRPISRCRRRRSRAKAKARAEPAPPMSTQARNSRRAGADRRPPAATEQRCGRKEDIGPAPAGRSWLCSSDARPTNTAPNATTACGAAVSGQCGTGAHSDGASEQGEIHNQRIQ